MSSITIPRTPADVNAEWLTDALRGTQTITKSSVSSFDMDPDIAAGKGFMGQLARIGLHYDQPEEGAPASLIAKFLTYGPENRVVADLFRLYETETRFYEQLADKVSLRTPRRYHSARCPNCTDFILLMEDLAPARVGDQVVGCSKAQSELAIRELAKFHAAWWDSPSLAELDWPGPTLAAWAPEWAQDPASSALLRRYIQTTCSPRQAERLMRLSLTSDVTEVLPLVQVPTLVLRAQDAPMPPAEAVREFADLIPGAIYREFPGSAVFLYAVDPELLADVIEEFVTGTAPAPVSSRVLATVLFTDLVGSTARAASAGDRAWAELLERHHDAVRGAVAAHGGETVKTLGDGVLALFTGPAQGVRCAQRVVHDAEGLGLEVRTGLHTGEVERAGDDVAGLAVHLAARIMGLAQAGEILASRTVRDLVIGSELHFTDRGEHELKGIPDRWAVYAATV